MSIVIAHEKRRREILAHALEVFITEGFEATTFQKIADRAHITRTTLYLYFKNKKDLFNYSIKQLMSEVEGRILAVQKDTTLNTVDKLIQVLWVIMDHLEENQRLLQVILDYLRCLSAREGSAETRVRRRTIRLRHILATMVIAGIREGAFKPITVRNADDLLYGLLEAATFQLTVLGRPSVEGLKHAAALAVQRLQVDSPPRGEAKIP
ncbi:MAG: TetR/AcrR family transcriptional regulator [Spirochaetaceae bacterium]|jgi:AcrR family transcriptional regulator|nr:TetR/AcrR family transcriptional regulator [Spirochaetaceae bacterium]